jgi:hypothetical protein
VTSMPILPDATPIQNHTCGGHRVPTSSPKSNAPADRVPGCGVRAAAFSRSPAGMVGVVRLPRRAA